MPGAGPALNDLWHQRNMDDVRQQAQDRAAAYLERGRAYFVKTVETAAARNPEIKPEIFQAIVTENNRLHEALVAEQVQAYQDSPTPGMLQQNINTIKTKYATLLRDKIYKDYGDEGNAALSAVSKEMRGESVFAGPVKMLYNSENGGLQWGGVLSGVSAALLGYNLTGGMGGIMQILATVAIGAAGAYIGHKVIDGTPEPLKLPDFDSASKDPVAPARDRVREVSDDGVVTTAARDAATPAPTSDKPAEVATRPTPAAATTAQPDFGKILADASKDPKPATDTLADARTMGLRNEKRLAAPTNGIINAPVR